MEIVRIFENNRKWASRKLNKDPDYFVKLSKGQKPELLYIGCSDSRVAGEEIFKAKPGEIFVHRNIANLVPLNDANSLSVIDYAVNKLSVKNIVVCGHYQCGGIKAAIKNKGTGLIDVWLKNIKDVYSKNQKELNVIGNEKEKFDRMVELNVIEQCKNILRIPFVFEAVKSGDLEVHAWVFGISSGKIVDLKFKPQF